MKFLLNSTTFYPAIGGLENVAMDIAMEFVKAGHEVMLIFLALVLPRESASDCQFAISLLEKLDENQIRIKNNLIGCRQQEQCHEMFLNVTLDCTDGQVLLQV